LRHPARFLDAKPNRRRNKSPCWRCWSRRRCRHGGRSLFDRFLNDRWFFDCSGFGHDHDWGCFIDFNRRRWFDLDDGWWRRRDGNRNFNG